MLLLTSAGIFKVESLIAALPFGGGADTTLPVDSGVFKEELLATALLRAGTMLLAGAGMFREELCVAALLFGAGAGARTLLLAGARMFKGESFIAALLLIVLTEDGCR